MEMKQSAFDRWLTTQPEQGAVHVTKPEFMFLISEPDMTDDCEDQYPVDEWQCRDCEKPLGFYISSDDGGGWSDAWLLADTDEHLCEDCYEKVTEEVDFPEQPDCDRCGALAGDEHRAPCIESSDQMVCLYCDTGPHPNAENCPNCGSGFALVWANEVRIRRCRNCQRVESSEMAVEGDLCEACFASMPDGAWVSAPWETR